MLPSVLMVVVLASVLSCLLATAALMLPESSTCASSLLSTTTWVPGLDVEAASAFGSTAELGGVVSTADPGGVVWQHSMGAEPEAESNGNQFV